MEFRPKLQRDFIDQLMVMPTNEMDDFLKRLQQRARVMSQLKMKFQEDESRNSPVNPKTEKSTETAEVK